MTISEVPGRIVAYSKIYMLLQRWLDLWIQIDPPPGEQRSLRTPAECGEVRIRAIPVLIRRGGGAWGTQSFCGTMILNCRSFDSSATADSLKMTWC